MGVSLIASLGRSGSRGSSGTSPGWSDSTIDSGGGGSGGIEDEEDGSCLHRYANDDSLCDYCESYYKDVRDLTFGGVLQSNFAFSEPYAFDYENKQTRDGMVFGFKYGAVTTEDGYLKFYTRDSDVGTNSDSYFSFNFSANEYGHHMNYKDYFTLDFDLWSDDEFIKGTSFVLWGDSNSGSKNTTKAIKIYKDTEGYYLTTTSRELVDKYIYLGSDPVHLTFVIQVDHSDLSQSKVKFYANGVFMTEESTSFADNALYSIHHMRMLIAKQDVESGKSLCIDNIKFCTYGDGSGYDGELAKLFESDDAELRDNADWICY